MAPIEYTLVLSIALFVSVTRSEPSPKALNLEDLVTNAGSLLKSYGVKENTLTDARIYFEETVGSTKEISQTAKTVKDSFAKAKDIFNVNFENVRNFDDVKSKVEIQAVKAIESLDSVKSDLQTKVATALGEKQVEQKKSYFDIYSVPYFRHHCRRAWTSWASQE